MPKHESWPSFEFKKNPKNKKPFASNPQFWLQADIHIGANNAPFIVFIDCSLCVIFLRLFHFYLILHWL